jgi:predicted signal transduction protein with EAL and GGDEF domain
VARLGGDEFAVFLPEIARSENAVELAKRILTTLHEPFVVDEEHFILDASIGIALIPEHGDDKNTVLRRADMAMYAAKRTRSGYCIFDAEQGENNSIRRLTLMSEMRKALDSDEFYLHFQPKVDIKTRKLCGVEALLRWNNPKRGFVSPGEFMPLAEQGGLIKAFTARVIRMALEQERKWLDAGLRIPVAVNLSALNLMDPELPDHIGGMLEKFGVSPDFLELEITESVIMTTSARGRDIIDRLSAMGIDLTIDDFGTGYSSLAYLKRLPVKTIKIDLSFVIHLHEDETDATIVQSIIQLGHNLGLRVTAEGVEKPEIWNRLHSLDCDLAQGFLISRPLPADKLEQWLEVLPWRVPDAPDDLFSEGALL